VSSPPPSLQGAAFYQQPGLVVQLMRFQWQLSTSRLQALAIELGYVTRALRALANSHMYGKEAGNVYEYVFFVNLHVNM